MADRAGRGPKKAREPAIRSGAGEDRKKEKGVQILRILLSYVILIGKTCVVVSNSDTYLMATDSMRVTRTNKPVTPPTIMLRIQSLCVDSPNKGRSVISW